MTYSKRTLSLILLTLMVLLVGCGGEEIASSEVASATLLATHPPTAIPVFTTTPTHTPTSTPTITVTPTRTLIPTTTPFLTVTPVPTIDTKTVFLGYRFTGGDGGDPSDLYYGRGMPSLVIYTDGQVIIREIVEGQRNFLETTISSAEMCQVLFQLQEKGFFEEYDPVYAFDETTEYSDGAPYVEMIVNGPLIKHWGFYEPYTEYLIPPLKQSFELVQNYRPSGETYYEPERLILRIENADDIPQDDSNIVPWPETLPSISELWQDPINSEVLVEGEWVAPIIELFDYRLAGRLFSDEGVIYHIILRPLLPHENPLPSLNWPHFSPETFNLPFDCPDLELPAIDPSRTPLPTPTHEPIAQLIGQGRILFDSLQNGNREVYVMNADGTNVLNLTNHLAKDEMAVWSPDGQKIAFVSNRNGNDELFVMNADGTNVTRVTYSPAREIAPKWSPDGKQLIFMSNRIGNWRYENWQLFVIDFETGVESQFTETFSGNMYVPDWSPDGEKILFSSNNPDALRIYMMDKNGENQTLLGFGTGAVWSPDGQHIASLRGSQISLMNADGTDLRTIRSNPQYKSGLDWSPDGAYLVYTSTRAGEKEEIYAIRADGEGRPIQLTFNSVEDNSSAWSP